MRRFVTLVLVSGLVAVLGAACSLASSEETAYPLPSAAIDFPLPTQTVSTPTTCPPSELASVKVEWDPIQRVLSIGGEKVIWPNGFSARILPSGRLEILAPDGTVVARDGDTLQLGGSDYQHVCRVGSVEY